MVGVSRMGRVGPGGDGSDQVAGAGWASGVGHHGW